MRWRGAANVFQEKRDRDSFSRFFLTNEFFYFFYSRRCTSLLEINGGPGGVDLFRKWAVKILSSCRPRRVFTCNCFVFTIQFQRCSHSICRHYYFRAEVEIDSLKTRYNYWLHFNNNWNCFLYSNFLRMMFSTIRCPPGKNYLFKWNKMGMDTFFWKSEENLERREFPFRSGEVPENVSEQR